jgi:3',5'-cyclic AMP phosphodiesterase CpdA
MSVEKHETPEGKAIERRDFIKRAAIGMSAMALGLVALGCNGSSSSSTGTTSSQPLTFAVITDIHVLDGDLLGDSGTAYDTYVAADPKMLNLSEDTLDVALASILSAKPSFVIIPGDLTKDGEYVDHLVVAGRLSVLVAAGIPVYVVPGNHDINNPSAYNYLTNAAAPNITPSQFQAIYGPYGYSTALYKDPNSLSYIAEPAPGLWLFAIDSCEYQNNLTLGTPVTAGQIGASTLTWLESHLALAQAQGKVVIGMEHHLIMEHFTGQETFFPDYILSNYLTAGPALAAAGLNLIFTGHFHANDVAQTTYSNGFTLTDVATGSTVIAPCPYRFVTANLSAKTFKITTSTVGSLPDNPDYATSSLWQTYEDTFIYNGMNGVAQAMLEAAPYAVPAATAQEISPAFATAIAAFYAGDPTFSNAPASIVTLTDALVGSANTEVAQLGAAIMQIWKPNATLDDNNLTITL